jgi:hypothetical protein
MKRTLTVVAAASFVLARGFNEQIFGVNGQILGRDQSD